MSTQKELFTPEENGHGALKPWHPSELRPRHYVVLSLHAAGLTNKEICEVTGYSESRVSVIINDPRAAEHVQTLVDNVADFVPEVRERLELLSNEALDCIVEQMRRSGDERVAQRSAFGILDRAGYTKIERRLVATAEVPIEAAQEMSRALLESGRTVEADWDYEVEDEA